MTINVILAEDHVLFRSGLKQILSMNEEIHVVGEVGSGEEAVEISTQLQPDLLLLDISLPGISGIEVIPLVKKKCPQTKILIISMYDMSEYIRSAFKAGADGYLLKTADSEEFFFAIQSLFRGQIYISSELANVMLDAYMQKEEQETSDALESLTMREREILVFVASGLSNKEIAAKLNIAEKTVTTHRTNFMRKLSLHNVREITMFAVRNSLIDIENK